MSMPFYVSPEQLMKDRADFAQQGIAKGRSLVAAEYDKGIVTIADNPSRNLRKISEIYDRISFAGVGRYNEYDQLRIAGIRHADVKGYTYSRDDVDAQSLANDYAQMLGMNFTHENKPLEVEILVASVGYDREGDRLFHIRYDGSINDETDFAVLGGETEAIEEKIKATHDRKDDLATTVKKAVAALSQDGEKLKAEGLEIAALDRTVEGRCYRRFEKNEISEMLK